jgi:hypothetical protein
MRAEQLRELLRRELFRPGRLVMSSGQTYDIAGPEWMLVTQHTTAVGVPGRAGDGEVVTLLENFHITEAEPISTPAVG